MEDVAEREAEAERLEAEMDEACGLLHAATARLVGLTGQRLESCGRPAPPGDDSLPPPGHWAPPLGDLLQRGGARFLPLRRG